MLDEMLLPMEIYSIACSPRDSISTVRDTARLGDGVKSAIVTAMSHAGLLLCGLLLVWTVPPFSSDAHFWVPAFAAVQVWLFFFVRAGRTVRRSDQ